MTVKRGCKQCYNLLYGEKDAQKFSGNNTKAQWNCREIRILSMVLST
jgi:hypothetical protein